MNLIKINKLPNLTNLTNKTKLLLKYLWSEIQKESFRKIKSVATVSILFFHVGKMLLSLYGLDCPSGSNVLHGFREPRLM